MIPNASTLVLDSTVLTLNPLWDSMDLPDMEPLVLVLAHKTPTHVLTPKASTLDPLEDLTEPLIVEPSVCVLASKAPTLVVIPKDSTHDPLKDLAEPLKVEPSFFMLTPKDRTPDPIKDPTEPLNVEPLVPLKVDAPVDPNGLVSTHGTWVINNNDGLDGSRSHDGDPKGVAVTAGI